MTRSSSARPRNKRSRRRDERWKLFKMIWIFYASMSSVIGQQLCQSDECTVDWVVVVESETTDESIRLVSHPSTAAVRYGTRISRSLYRSDTIFHHTVTLFSSLGNDITVTTTRKYRDWFIYSRLDTIKESKLFYPFFGWWFFLFKIERPSSVFVFFFYPALFLRSTWPNACLRYSLSRRYTLY